MSTPLGMDDELLHAEPVYKISRVAAPGGVPLWLTLLCLLPTMLATLIFPPSIIALPFGWRKLQKWIDGDLKKPQVWFRYMTGARWSSDPIVLRRDGTRGRRWGGSTVTALAQHRVGGLPRFIELPED
jgi:hypothetical protein